MLGARPRTWSGLLAWSARHVTRYADVVDAGTVRVGDPVLLS
ncbi:MAG TPA: hypothetical protein VFR07_19140 [Mycobacteriales bacterium]|jgi:hypothetical protein|nr:hypothetical protein [Mycobacteriales bacterium]